MKVLNKKNSKPVLLTLLLFSLLFTQCRVYKSHENKTLIRESKIITQKYGTNNGKDTLLLENGFHCIYINGRISEYGKFKGNEKIGNWYFYNKEGEIDKVEKYKNGSHKIIYSRSLINQSW